MVSFREGKVTSSEVVAQPVTSPTVNETLAIVGTGIGLRDAVLSDNVPMVFSSARAFIEAARPDSGTPTGTLWAAAHLAEANAHENVIIVQAEANTPAALQTALGPLRRRVRGLLADLVAAPGMTANIASGVADASVGHLQTLCEVIRAVFAVNIPVTGADKGAQIAAAKAYADANRAGLGAFLFSRGGAGIDLAPGYLAGLARMDNQQAAGRGANPRGLQIRGVTGTMPQLDYNLQSRGIQTDDLDTLYASNIIPVIEREGVQAWGTRFNITPDSLINEVRTGQQIQNAGDQIAEGYLTGQFTPELLSDLVQDLSGYCNQLVTVGQLRSYEVMPNEGASTDRNIAVDVNYRVEEIVNAVHLNFTRQ